MTWDEIIIQLKEWQADPAQLADESEGMDAPTDKAFRSAIDFARFCGRLGVKDSLRVVSCGDGGLGFLDVATAADVLPTERLVRCQDRVDHARREDDNEVGRVRCEADARERSGGCGADLVGLGAWRDGVAGGEDEGEQERGGAVSHDGGEGVGRRVHRTRRRL